MSKSRENNYFGNERALNSFVFFAIMTCIIYAAPELALALTEGPKSLQEVASTVQREVQGSGLSIAMNAAGLAAIGYSLFSGFNKGFLVAGGLILAFANLFFPFVNDHYPIQ